MSPEAHIINNSKRRDFVDKAPLRKHRVKLLLVMQPLYNGSFKLNLILSIGASVRHAGTLTADKMKMKGVYNYFKKMRNVFTLLLQEQNENTPHYKLINKRH